MWLEKSSNSIQYSVVEEIEWQPRAQAAYETCERVWLADGERLEDKVYNYC